MNSINMEMIEWSEMRHMQRNDKTELRRDQSARSSERRNLMYVEFFEKRAADSLKDEKRKGFELRIMEMDEMVAACHSEFKVLVEERIDEKLEGGGIEDIRSSMKWKIRINFF